MSKLGKLLAPSAEGCEQREREHKKTFSLNNQSEPPKSCGGPGIKSCLPAPALGTNPNTNLGDALDRASPVAKLEQITPRAFRILDVCRATGLGRTTIYEAIKSRALIARRYRRCTVVLAEDLAAFLRNLPTT
jgi:hypothetical protein